ncbi:MAG: hypothetical protein NTX86_03760 [Candidatus Dependentiae bacterium]|nr:hypothetical protein [Candidatus Dependentiae bacterium]
MKKMYTKIFTLLLGMALLGVPSALDARGGGHGGGHGHGGHGHGGHGHHGHGGHGHGGHGRHGHGEHGRGWGHGGWGWGNAGWGLGWGTAWGWGAAGFLGLTWGNRYYNSWPAFCDAYGSWNGCWTYDGSGELPYDVQEALAAENSSE